MDVELCSLQGSQSLDKAQSISNHSDAFDKPALLGEMTQDFVQGLALRLASIGNCLRSLGLPQHCDGWDS